MKERDLLKKQNVVVVGRGKKTVRGRKTDRDAIVVGVIKKMPEAQLKKSDIVPKKIKNLETDVVETGEINALAVDRKSKIRPAPGGVSIGHFEITAGTLGMVARKGGERYILSNNHVLANCNKGEVGDPIVQPGKYDDGTLADTIAHLSEYVPIRFGNSGCFIGNIVKVIVKALNKALLLPNTVDAAIARPIHDDDVSDEILEVGIPEGFNEVDVGDAVKKSGRTTGLMSGEVTMVGAVARVNYGEEGIATFEDQIITTNIGAPGDSGSIVLNEANHVVGLLFAGSDRATIVNRIENVIQRLHLDREMTCPICAGTGAVTCPNCAGTGKI